MSEEELIPVNVWLAGRSYRIRVKADEEEAVRKAAKIADEKVIELRSHYAGKDDQDFLAMCLLMYASDSATNPYSDPVMLEQIADMTARIDETLKS